MILLSGTVIGNDKIDCGGSQAVPYTPTLYAVSYYVNNFETWTEGMNLFHSPNALELVLVFRLSGARDLHRQIAIAQSPMKKIKDQPV